MAAAQDTVRDVQRVLDVTPDGKWGPRTTTAWEQASAETRAQLETLIKSDGYSVETLKRVTYDLKTPSFELRPGTYNKAAGLKPEAMVPAKAVISEPAIPANLISESNLDSMIARVATKRGVSQSLLKGFINLEAVQKTIKGIKYYDANSRNGQFRGLGQMGKDAWTDVESKVGASYDRVFEPELNLDATALYALKNMAYSRNKGFTGQFTPEVLYTLHNQGAGGFMRLLKGGAVAGTQSTKAKQVIAEAVSQNRLA